MLTIVDTLKELEAEIKVLSKALDEYYLVAGKRAAIINDIKVLNKRIKELTVIFEFTKSLERQFAKEEI